MEKEDQLGYGLPIVCPPGQIPTHAPEGGCLRPCEYRLSCGQYCHTDLDNHRSMRCNHRCQVTCPRAHPCPTLCFEDCGELHSKLGKLETVNCVAQGANINGIMACSADPTNFECNQVCGGETTCCSRTCKSRCHECQKVT
ncbi:hypothetical protein EDB84DRAFT_1552345, partial [Lactarius hengduanensis]